MSVDVGEQRSMNIAVSSHGATLKWLLPFASDVPNGLALFEGIPSLHAGHRIGCIEDCFQDRVRGRLETAAEIHHGDRKARWRRSSPNGQLIYMRVVASFPFSMNVRLCQKRRRSNACC